MRYCAVLLIFQFVVASGHAQRLSIIKTQTTERITPSAEPEFESILLPRTQKDRTRQRTEIEIPDVKVSASNTRTELLDSASSKRQRINNQDLVSNLVQHSEASSNGYESQISTAGVKSSKVKSTIKEKEEKNTSLNTLRKQKPDNQRKEHRPDTEEPRRNEIYETREEKNARARQRYRDMSSVQKEKIQARNKARIENMSVEAKKRYRERIRILREAKKHEVNTRRRIRYRERKFQHQPAVVVDSTEARRHRINILKEKRNRRAIADSMQNTANTRYSLRTLPRMSGRSSPRGRRTLRVSEKSSSSVSTSSASADLHAHEQLTGSDGEFSLGAFQNAQPTRSFGRIFSGAFRYASPIITEDGLTEIPRNWPSPETKDRASSENTIQKAFRQFRNDEL